MLTRRSRRSAIFTPVITSVVALAVLGGLAVQPGLLDRDTGQRADPAADSYDWLYDTSAEQWRQDQCLMTDVLRLGGPSMTQTAQDALNQPQDKLHTLADRKHWEQTPLATAYQKDRDAARSSLEALQAQRAGWQKPLEGLTTPGGINNSDFHWPPGSPGDGKQDFYTQTGLSKWISDRFWTEEGGFYQDPTPKAYGQAAGMVKYLGFPLYGKDPDPHAPGGDWNRDLAEREAFKHLTEWAPEPMGADNARMFMASGGFPRTAPQPGTAEYRIAVEDLKSRFAGCAWRDPIDPNRVLDDISATASGEWQQEIASQQAQRNQILTANSDATKALASGAKALGDMLGHSWVADHAARWQDYWSPGGVGAVGDKPAVIEVHAAGGKCLDVENSGTNDGSPVQVYWCNGTSAQQWQVWADDHGLHLRSVVSQKCLDVSNNDAANGTRIQIWTCNSSPAQTWEYNLRATTSLMNVGTGKCLDLHTYEPGYDSWLWDCNGTGPQQFDIKPSGHGAIPPQADFAKAKAAVTGAQAGAKKQLDVLKAQAAAAKKAAATSDAAAQSAYTIADANGAPPGRGLLVGQQKAQVTQGAVAALEAMVKAGETAEAATRASGADSETIAQRALAQAAQAKAEFRREAAHTAELQAKASADAAKSHRDNAKKDAETAKAKLGDAVKAESDAKVAAADAHAKRLAAEAEEATAKKEKGTAAAKQGEAAKHRENAQAEATKAQDARTKAEAAEATAVDRRNGAVKARDNAKAKRDDAWDAEQRADAERAKADAKAAYAASLDTGSEANAARTAADEADQHAKDAETAAGKARGEANAATKAAEEADAAATRADAAAKRSRADADDAQAAKLRADAAVKTATSAAADAIAASQHAASEARSAVALADEAEGKAKTAKTQADLASREALKAVAASAKAAGYAYVTAQAAADAGKSASQVADPANDAIQLGSPYVTTDSTATLIVLTGQASKTIAEQQKAIAEAHAKNAQDEAANAKVLADRAQQDTKAAYQHSANATGYAADARGYAKEALGYSAEAATTASLAAASLARTTEFDRQAAADAVAADQAAVRSEAHAKDARTSADQAALDATAARNAAAQAEQDAKAARTAADRAATAASEAEQAAKDADKYAKEAQESADRAEKAAKAKQINTGTVPDGSGGSIGNMFYVIDHTERIGKPETLKKTAGCDGLIDALFYRGDCTLTVKIRYKAFLDLYSCTAKVLEPSKSTCPASATVYLGQRATDELAQEVTHNITIAEYQAGIDPVDILFGSWIKCVQKLAPGGESGSWGGCAWAAVDVALLFSGQILRPIADAVRAADAAARTGIGFADAYRALRSVGLSEEAIAGISKTQFQRLRATCLTDSFPAGTRVLLAGGTSKPIDTISVGDQVLATDPNGDITRSAPVTATHSHPADRLLQIALANGGRIATTPGHRMYVQGRGWVKASDLHMRDPLLTATGAVDAVVGISPLTAPQRVWDLSVADLHTFYVLAGESPVLVHNVNCPPYIDVAPSGLGIVADIDTEGIVSFVINSGPDTPKGGEMFNAALAHFGDKVKGVKAYWQNGGTLSDNLNSFNEAVRSHVSLEEAARAYTFTGKMSGRAGFSKVEFTELRGMPGEYTHVGVIFR
ncbi:RICIN domain-containing protein [Streptomyces sp. NPDC059564]|uniref:RICIN domain-containing protein n=1 Tax=Streptomyces sp. NPDC059564 TaxID=3346865 RepID=UPI0036B7485E